MKSQAYVPGDTIAAIATPQGPGAIGVIRLSGDRAVSLAASLVTLANSLKMFQSVLASQTGGMAADNGWIKGCMSDVLRSFFSYHEADGKTMSE